MGYETSLGQLLYVCLLITRPDKTTAQFSYYLDDDKINILFLMQQNMFSKTEILLSCYAILLFSFATRKFSGCFVIPSISAAHISFSCNIGTVFFNYFIHTDCKSKLGYPVRRMSKKSYKAAHKSSKTASLD